jgi:hypothetical protein
MEERSADGHVGVPSPGAPAPFARAVFAAAASVGAAVTLIFVLEAPLGGDDIGSSVRLMIRAAAVVAVAWALLAALAAHGAALRPFEIATGAALTAVASAALEVGADVRALQLGVAVLCLVTAFAAALTAGRRLFQPCAAALAVLMAAAILTALPLWAAPVAELTAARQWTVDAVVAASPLTYVALAADFDYLRTEWFYRMSVLGTLRYEYPAFAFASAVYALPALALGAAALRRRKTVVGALAHFNGTP